MSVLLHLQWNSVVWKMREGIWIVARRCWEVGTGPARQPPGWPSKTNATRRQNHSVRRFRLPQIETSTRSALIKRHSMTSSSPRGARVAPLILARHRFLCSHFSAGGVGEKVFYYRSDKRGRRSVAARLLVPGESSDASGGGGRGALMSRGTFSISGAPALWFPLPLAGLVKVKRQPAADFDRVKEPLQEG